jgi:hypothetical protein
MDVVAEKDFERQEQEDHAARGGAAIDVIAKEEIAAGWRIAALFENAKKRREIAVDVANNDKVASEAKPRRLIGKNIRRGGEEGEYVGQRGGGDGLASSLLEENGGDDIDTRRGRGH